jgi:hypothetical protein
MSNSWIAPVFGTVVGGLLIYMGYNMYNSNKQSLNQQEEQRLLDKERQEDSMIGGRKTKRRKNRKNASKKR